MYVYIPVYIGWWVKFNVTRMCSSNYYGCKRAFDVWAMLLLDRLITLVTIGKTQWVLHLVATMHILSLPAHRSIVFWGFIVVCDQLLKADALKERGWAEKIQKSILTYLTHSKNEYWAASATDSKGINLWFAVSKAHWYTVEIPKVKQNSCHLQWIIMFCQFRTWTFNLIC